ncbi:Fc.00g059210.m01.CDS01 [Cosmosporella sp. VM-42]
MASRQVLARRASLCSPSLAWASRRPCQLLRTTSCKALAGHRYYSESSTSPTQRSKVHQDREYQKIHEVTTSLDPLEWRRFPRRHIGPRDEDVEEMLKALGPGAETMDNFVSQVIPEDIISPPEVAIQGNPFTEDAASMAFTTMFKGNPLRTWMNGGGFYPAAPPPVIKRNILENPAWYTSYTPYQPEISQGRLESLLNYQTMVSDLTGLPIANASLLDEGTAAAEAMTMSMSSLPVSRQKRAGKTYVVSHLVHPTSLRVMGGRAEGFGITLKKVDLSSPDAFKEIKNLGDDLVGVLVQYPDTNGGVRDYRKLADLVHKQGALLSAATDLMALTLLTPPGEWGADIAFGNSQRFGVPLGYGGPHAAFMSVKESSKRRLPGRIVGVSKDRLGRRALRLALQTREQHIRREKATSNVCTAQALLANMAVMFAIYHGPKELQQMATECLRYARVLQDAAEHYGLEVNTATLEPKGRVLSDTITISFDNKERVEAFHKALDRQGISARKNYKPCEITLACSHTSGGPDNFTRIVRVFHEFSLKNGEDAFIDVAAKIWKSHDEKIGVDVIAELPDAVRRTSPFLTHPVFNTHHSETAILRYMHHLQSKDLSLVHSMIPLGSCTMKLNATSQMELITNPKCNNIHPNMPLARLPGWKKFLDLLNNQLIALTGMHDVSLQPNSGAQGEFAGLRVIRKYHEQNPGTKRDICLIPVSAHGTNPASAAMAGMRVVPVKCDTATGNLDMEDLEAKCVKHKEELGAIMITYPSTYGVFEPDVKKACELVHKYGGLVYMDGANMNAQIGLTSPGAIGADVCHLNLHKTFCIPHGGGGPGVGPICVKAFLSPFLPHQKGQSQVTSATFGSASILPISWMYMACMGDEGLRDATKAALLNANYLLARLKDHYPILYTNANGRCAHEFIVDARPFKQSAGIEVIDIAKRLQDYGFHAPTMSWPVPGTLMIEPTESESKEELDRFVDAMISIREEIREVEEGKQPRVNNVLKNSPHPQRDIIIGDGEGKWDRPYSREKAAYPLPYLEEKKFWPTVGRVDDTYGDTNLFCTCPPVEDTTAL